MTPAAIETQTLLRDLHPKQHGLYLVTLHPDWEIPLFYELSLQIHDPVWAVEVEKLILDLNESTAAALRNPIGAVQVLATFTPNKWPISVTNPIMVDAEGVAKLTPIL